MLVGNKCDLKHLRAVTTEEASVYAESHKMAFIETSALDSTGVTTAFHSLLTEIYHLTASRHLINENKSGMPIPQGSQIQLDNDMKTPKKCC